jgi:hypothetical protein
MKNLSTLLGLLLLLSSCGSSHEPTEERKYDGLPLTIPDPSSEISEEQQRAFDALNTLQVNSEGHLYSTFPNIKQPFYPADYTFNITQEQLLTALEMFATRHCKSMPLDQRERLIGEAVMAQEQYEVHHCLSTASSLHFSLPSDTTDITRGTWVMPAVLDRRDVILHW